ncbi:hypothetical protein HDU96_008932 [Phlyctochytrium bullatum]|nr:hypothetical protein HDU96_008932 [Phlyctochytrium bullatum]
MRLAILKCDVFAPTISAAAGGEYGHLFQTLFDAAVSKLAEPVTVALEVFEVMEGAFPAHPEAYDGLVITGSKFGVNDGLPWIDALVAYVRGLKETRTKIVGVCFGHQVVAKAFGGEVTSNPKGWEAGWTALSVTAEGRTLLGGEKATVNILSMHKDHVCQVPPGFEVLMFTDICPVQAMRFQNQVITIQAHPEFTPHLVEEIIRLRTEAKVFTEEFKASATAVLNEGRALDGVWFASKVIEFVRAGRA